MVSWETVVEGASMPPLVLTPIQSGQGLPDCVYNARLVFARTFSLWKHHNLILVPRSTPGKSGNRVRREKAVVHSGSNPPGNWFAPPGSNQSSS